ncbi:MAG: hypothetical protein IJ086_11150 [Clostridium sp.]|nr:hypothetical protein [Clostridium sp.]
MNFYNTVISGLRFLTEDVVEIAFKLSDGQKIDFTPGQFILVEVSQNPNVMRAYSVLDYNVEKNELKIGVKKVENGQATTIMFDTFRVGMNIRIAGAMGNKLIVDKTANEDILLVATGIGITPMLCVLNDLVESGYKGKIDFLYGARTLSELHYIEDLSEISKNNDNVMIIPVLSRDNIDGVIKGYVTDVVKSMNLENKTIYMCSSNAVAKSFKETLMGLDFEMSKFKCESA